MLGGMPTVGGSPACSSKDFVGVTDVFSTEKPFMARNKNEGTAQRWESAGSGGDCWGWGGDNKDLSENLDSEEKASPVAPRAS